MRKLLLAFLGMVFVISSAWAQETTVSGKVSATDDGSSLPGVNVVLKGTTTGTVTDVDGNYRLTLPDGQGVLVFSFIGFATQEVEIGGRTTIDLALESEVTTLGEVVVTGVAGQQSTKKLAFTVDKVNEDLIKQAPGVNAATALQGKVAGVSVTQASGTPGSNAAIRLRGSSNLVGSQAPLIIVDGVLLEGSGQLADIPSEDIESVEIVKGAAAASLYGSRAANGVVNIMTKRGSSKANVTDITFRTEFGKNELAKTIELAEHHPYEMNGDGTVDYNTLSTDGIADNDYSQIYDQQDLFFNPGTFNSQYISVASSGPKTRFFMSGGNQNQSGVVDQLEGYNRKNIRLNIDHDISDVFELSASQLYSTSFSDQTTSDFGPFYSLLFQPPDVDLLATNQEDGSPYDWNVGEPGTLERNPLYRIENNQRSRDRTRFLGSYKLAYSPTNNLKFEGQYTLDWSNMVFENFYQKGYLSDDVSGVDQGYLYRSFTTAKYETANIKGTFYEKFGDLNMTIQAMYMYENDERSFTEVGAYDFRFNGLKSMDNSTNTPSNRTERGSFDRTIRSENVYLIGQFDYQDKIIFDGLYRYDGSSLFGEDNRWNSFGRLSLAYRITEDITIPGFQEMKIRASYGTAGNRPGFSYRFETYSESGNKNTLGNNGLRSSLSTELELGLDMDFANRHNLSFTYADTESTQQFFELNLSAAAGGFSSQWVNLEASLDATVFEASYGFRAITKPDHNLTFGLIFSKIDQVISKFDNVPTKVGPSNAFILQEGEKFGTMYGQMFATDISEIQATGQYDDILASGLEVEVDDNGYVISYDPADKQRTQRPVKIIEADGTNQFVIGDINPDFNLGLNWTWNYKGLTVYGVFDWKQGGDVYNQTNQWILRELRGGEVDQSGAANPKPVEYYSTLYNTNATTSHFVEDGTYVKFRELSVYYSFGEVSIFKDIRIGFVGRNLLTISDYSGYDPEVATADVTEDQTNYMFDGYGYPNFRTYSGSIELKF